MNKSRAVAAYAKRWTYRCARLLAYTKLPIFQILSGGSLGIILFGSYGWVATLVCSIALFILLRRPYVWFGLSIAACCIWGLAAGTNETSKFSVAKYDWEVVYVQGLTNQQTRLLARAERSLCYWQIETTNPIRIGDVFRTDRAKDLDLQTSPGYKSYLDGLGAKCFFEAEGVQFLGLKVSPFRLGEELAERLKQPLFAYLPYWQAGLVAGMLWGDKSAIDSDTKQAFTQAGVTHIVAVSGFNVAVVCGIVYIGKGFVHRRYIGILAIMFALCFLCLVGPYNFPALRAVIMLVVTELFVLLGRPPNVWLGLGYSTLLSLLVYPDSWKSLSWQLSFAVVFSLLIGVSLLPKLKLWGRDLLSNLANSLVANWAVLPFLLPAVKEIAAVGIITNLVALPLVPWVTYAAILLIALSGVPVLASFIASFLVFVTDALIGIITSFSAHDFWIKDLLPFIAIGVLGFLLFIGIDFYRFWNGKST